MQYTILNKTNNGPILICTVEYILNDNSTVTVDVNIFAPQTIDDVLTAISNRALTEQTNLDNITVAQELFNNIVLNEQNTI